MKGVVFTEFLEMVEERFSLEMVDRVITTAAVPSGGAYTSVGTYPAGEMVALVGALSGHCGVEVPVLLRSFGEHLAGSFSRKFAALFAGATDVMAFLEGVEGYIHREVRKLYPDAELPRFDIERRSPDELCMTYRSPRGLVDLAEGLIVGVGRHFGDELEVVREEASSDGTMARLLVRRRAA